MRFGRGPAAESEGRPFEEMDETDVEPRESGPGEEGDERRVAASGRGAAAISPASEDEGEPQPDEEAQALREQFLRLAAEFDNYRKRESRERGEAWTRAKAALIEKLLEPVDDLTRVAHPDPSAASNEEAAGLLAGVSLVERKMLQALEREGLERIEAEGAAFDPAVHEAILTQPTGDPALDGRVAHVALAGYRFADRLLRPAKVVVWKLQS
ncbi:MAG: nucleotide exchange factor GrpE [Gemmatimonadota bacterium]